MIIDTHCHLDDKSFDEDLVQVIQRAKAQNVENIIIPGAEQILYFFIFNIANNLGMYILQQAFIHMSLMVLI